MHASKTGRAGEEVARRGATIVSRLEQALLPDHFDEYIAVDVDAEDHELARDAYSAATRLLARRPDADVYVARVGRSWTEKIGPRG